MTTEWKKTGFCCLAGLVLIVISTTSIFAAEYTMRIANDAAASHSWGRTSEQLKQYVEEVTKGRVKVDVHHASTLGKTREAIEMVKMGTLEVAMGGVSHFQRHVAELGIIGLPFLWKDSATMFEVLDGALGKYMEARLDAAGFHTLGFWDNGFRHITNNRKPILSVADLKGLKIRTMPNPVHIAFFKALGAAPTPMDWAEVFEALRTGVIDAQENPIAQIYTGKLGEVQKYCSLTGHVSEPGAVVMSKPFYNKLPDDLKLAVTTAARKATIWQRVENAKDNQRFLNDLKDGGMKINTLTDANIAEFRKIGIQGYDDVVKGFGKMGKRNFVVSGTHGKTTTSSMLAWLLRHAGRDPGFHDRRAAEKPRLRRGFTDSEFNVLEGDEYDTAFFDKRSKFLHYLPECVVINNIEFDHADIYDSLDEIKLTFRRLLNIVPRKGMAFINGDDPNCLEVANGAPCPVTTVGFGGNLQPAHRKHQLRAQTAVRSRSAASPTRCA